MSGGITHKQASPTPILDENERRMAPIKVIVVGGTGETGRQVIDGLLKSPTDFEITSITRPSSATNPRNLAFKEQGIKVVPLELTGPHDKIVDVIRDVDVVISCLTITSWQQQIPLIEAAKVANVKRFIPCNWGPVMPPKGVLLIREWKEDIISLIKKHRIPYTVIDVAWWHQGVHLHLPSGKTDYMVPQFLKDAAGNLDTRIPGDGNVPLTLADVRTIGQHVAKIIADPRTLNKYVNVYDEVLTYNQMVDQMEDVSGEKIERVYKPAKELEETIAATEAARANDPDDQAALFSFIIAQYAYSVAVRGDSTPEVADYLGYLDSLKLYPDLKPFPIKKFFEEAVAGTAKAVHDGTL